MSRFEFRRRWPKLLRIFIVNLLVLFVLLEVTSLGFFYYRTGTFFYGRGAIGANKPEIDTNFQQAGNDISLIYQFHPYFGFVYRQGYIQNPFINSPYASTYPTNNCGFLSSHNFPFKKTSRDQFIIGIFGGSVATMFSFYELENHVLTAALQRVPSLQKKELVVLNFAAGGYKQPQQLMVLDYFLSVGQEFDMVINIDGVNETEYWNNRFGVEVSMPLVHVSLPLTDLANKDLSPDELVLSLEILQTKERLRRATEKLDSRKTATLYTLAWLEVRYLQREYRKKSDAFASLKRSGQGKDSLIHLNRVEKPLDESDAYEQMADIWANSSLAMKELLSARNAQYFHFLQPNQYYPTGREFGEEERKIAIDPGNAIQESVTNAYPRLLSRMARLQASGVHAFSGVNAFDQTRDPVYVDNTCHYNKLGSEVFAHLIAERITEILH